MLEPWEPLVRITAEQELFAAKHSHASEASVIDFFVFDRENLSSIRSCIESVRGNLSPLRHLISSELWLAVNRLYLETHGWSAQALAAAGVSAFFADLQRHFYTIDGIIVNTMPRDLTYDLLEIGTMLERPDNVSRLLDVKYHYLLPRLEDIGGPADLRQWAAVLRSASAFEAFRKLYGNCDPGEPGGRDTGLRSGVSALDAVLRSNGSRRRWSGFRCGKRNPYLNIRLARSCSRCCTRAPRTRPSRPACTNF